MEKYDFQSVEKKWQGIWAERQLFRTGNHPQRPKYYCLEMYPYPSGELHMGHVKNYIIGDVVARYAAKQGCNVLHPIGWDSFGLPTENAALERGIEPSEWNARCVANMKEQFKKLGISYDWEREIDTSSPDYYGWTQWLFLKFYERGLAYRKYSPVNWCPKCSTVLANEQVIDGLCERCDTPVTTKELAQWFFKITAYSERLLEDLKLLQHWPERVRVMQEHWIGKSLGTEIDFLLPDDRKLTVFTTRPDTVYGVTFMVLAAEHPLVTELVKGKPNEKEVLQFTERIKGQSQIFRVGGEQKEGMPLGVNIHHPLTGEPVPLFIANYVLMEYGTGAVMGVPAHDQRDLEFARAQGLPVKVVIQPPGKKLSPETMREAYVEPGVQINSASFDGIPSEEAKIKITDCLESKGFGRKAVQYRLRDWCISRQRYWGAPIPVIYCDSCGTVPVPEKELPVYLPENVDFSPGWPAPLARKPEFVNTACPSCKKPAKRETDTMDTFVFSSWYFLRFVSPAETSCAFRPGDVNHWLPVDQYIGGIEHATVHLVYARFFTKVLYDLGLVNFQEPFERLFTQGMIYRDGAKMSKSKGNVVTPDEIIEKYGADTARLFILFVGPPEQDAEWNERGVEGSFRFVTRTYREISRYADAVKNALPVEDDRLADAERMLLRKLHQTIKRVREDMEKRWHFNTCVAALMEFLNVLAQFDPEKNPRGKDVWKECAQKFVVLLSPFVPHLAEELWEMLGQQGSVYEKPVPVWDEKWFREEAVTFVVQINGKVRDRLVVSADIPEEQLKTLALERPKIKTHINGREVLKVVVVPKKLVNVVVK